MRALMPVLDIEKQGPGIRDGLRFDLMLDLIAQDGHAQLYLLFQMDGLNRQKLSEAPRQNAFLGMQSVLRFIPG